MILIITTLFIHKINSVMCISIKVKVGKVCSLKNRGLRGKNECIQVFCHLLYVKFVEILSQKGFRDHYCADAAQSKKSIYR